MRDFELFVVGDGAPSATRELVEALAETDHRIRYFDYPKGERHGERNRHDALQQAHGEAVLYCGDDDLWLPNHIEQMCGHLKTVEFGHSVHMMMLALEDDATLDERVVALGADLADPKIRDAMCEKKFNTFGPTAAGHTLAAYRRLPEGWRPAPEDIWTDLHMWRQFLTMPDMKFGTLYQATTLHFPTELRKHLSMEDRAAELSHWLGQTEMEGFGDRLNMLVAPTIPDAYR